MYSYFDTHCDTLFKLYVDGTDIDDTSLQVNSCNFKSYENRVQCFSLYNDGRFVMQDFYDAAVCLKKQCEKSGVMELCTDTDSIDKALKSGKTVALLTIEALGNTSDFLPEDIFSLKKSGYIMAGLVWNNDNSLCGGAFGKNCGISKIAMQTLCFMENAGMIADISHMSQKSFDDVFEHFCKPIVASHSNSAYVCPHNRNLSDENILKIIKNGGVIGLNVYSDFVGKNNTVNDVVANADRIISLGGEANICVGADLDGISRAVEGISNCSDMTKLFDAFAGHNYPKKLIKDISFNNIYNIFKKYEI